MKDYILRSDAMNCSKLVYIECLYDKDNYIEAEADSIPVIFKRDLETIPASDTVNRAVILLKATYDLLSKQTKSGYVLNMLEQVVYYDDAECDGSCLMNDIECLLEEINDN